jgi:hypothetical protein
MGHNSGHTEGRTEEMHVFGHTTISLLDMLEPATKHPSVP